MVDMKDEEMVCLGSLLLNFEIWEINFLMIWLWCLILMVVDRFRIGLG